MARKSNGGRKDRVTDYRHRQAKRKNNPPAKIAGEGVVPPVPKAEYSYNPHLPPVLRFDVEGKPDVLPDLLAEARRRPLTDEEARLLADALRNREPWLEWAGKRETAVMKLTVDPVALHIHERVSAQAILKVARRLDVQRALFGDPEQAYHEAVQFYRHDVDWTNRMILGDSLQVMSSLARRENLAGKVQMIYIDPPYGIKFASNFQPEVGHREVKDKETDLTREPEVVKAYRDTFRLGVHSYLAYLRDRLIVAKELLADSGSIFVQISDVNVHRVRNVLEEVFGSDSFIAQIAFKKTTTATAELIPSTNDFLLWFARNHEQVKYRPVFGQRIIGGAGAEAYLSVELADGSRRRMTDGEHTDTANLPSTARPFCFQLLQSQRLGRPSGPGSAMYFEVQFAGRTFAPSGTRGWTTTVQGVQRLIGAGRAAIQGHSLSYVRYIDDFPVLPLNSMWTDTQSGSGMERCYVVQTNAKVIERCLLLTTDPGDLVLDPTCGGGTTAFVAEQWGRRWITVDTSRVAIAIARQRLLTAKIERYRIKGESPDGIANGEQPNGKGASPHPGFIYRTVPHITLKSIAQNTNLDPIFARHEPVLEECLGACNKALGKVTKELRTKLEAKLAAKERADGKKAITEADRRRWVLPCGTAVSAVCPTGVPPVEGKRKHGRDGHATHGQDLPAGGEQTGARATWEHWELPFDADPDWPKDLQEAVGAYRRVWQAKMDEVNGCIAANAEPEELVDQPDVVRGVVRVSGPFTVEGVQPPELSLGAAGVIEAGAGEGMFDGEPALLEGTFEVRPVQGFADTQNIPAYLDKMIRLLRADGVRFPNNKVMQFSRLEATYRESPSGLHAEGRWTPPGQVDADPEGEAAVCVAFGPQYGPVTAMQVEEAIRAANRAGYEALVVAGFSFDGAATAVIDEYETDKLKRGCMVHMAHIRPDVNPGMDGLLKEPARPGEAQLFTVFGQPRTSVEGPDGEGNYVVGMEGVDIYNPLDNSITPTDAGKVAAWFLDADYDGRTFCITQAFFPDRSAWDKLARALKGVVDEDRFEALSGTVSLPFPAGKHKRVAVKVIDPRGNEVMRIHRLE